MLRYPFSPNLSIDSIQSQTNLAKFFEEIQADRSKEELSGQRKQEASRGRGRTAELQEKQGGPWGQGYEVGERLEIGQVLKCLVGNSQGLGLCSHSNGGPLRNLNRRVPLPDSHF